ncbi:basic amino acids transporter-related [Anaeramoeba ignava]|uniref:Basic amino acids transporter-related n=1 Tax=Anaeramoeba ignava TaxID=1746090 RepID=A0A9Q0LW59_ANAIG|nr:basic amino acids transporter-related [Anaeramoeba ignava]
MFGKKQVKKEQPQVSFTKATNSVVKNTLEKMSPHWQTWLTGGTIGVLSELPGVFVDSLFNSKTTLSDAIKKFKDGLPMTFSTNAFLFFYYTAIKTYILKKTNLSKLPDNQKWKIGIFAGLGTCLAQAIIWVPVGNIRKQKEKARKEGKSSCTFTAIHDLGFEGLCSGFCETINATLPFYLSFFALSEGTAPYFSKYLAKNKFTPHQTKAVTFAYGAFNGFAAKMVSNPTEAARQSLFKGAKFDLSEVCKKSIVASISTGVRTGVKKFTFAPVFKMINF